MTVYTPVGKPAEAGCTVSHAVDHLSHATGVARSERQRRPWEAPGALPRLSLRSERATQAGSFVQILPRTAVTSRSIPLAHYHGACREAGASPVIYGGAPNDAPPTHRRGDWTLKHH